MTDPEAQVILEQYKAYIGDLGQFGARYAALHTLYFSLLGATIAVLGLTGTGKLLGPLNEYVIWIVAVFGICLCVLWVISTNYYRTAFSVKFEVLRELEEKLPVKPYTQETIYLGIHPKKRAIEDPDKTAVAGLKGWIDWIKGHRPHILTTIERLIPVVFIGLIVALAVQAEKQSPTQASAPAQAKKR